MEVKKLTEWKAWLNNLDQVRVRSPRAGIIILKISFQLHAFAGTGLVKEFQFLTAKISSSETGDYTANIGINSLPLYVPRDFEWCIITELIMIIFM